MDPTWSPYLLGGAAALLGGFSKTGLPGAAIPAVAMMTAAFPDHAKLAVGAILPLLLAGDLFAISWAPYSACAPRGGCRNDCSTRWSSCWRARPPFA